MLPNDISVLIVPVYPVVVLIHGLDGHDHLVFMLPVGPKVEATLLEGLVSQQEVFFFLLLGLTAIPPSLCGTISSIVYHTLR